MGARPGLCGGVPGNWYPYRDLIVPTGPILERITSNPEAEATLQRQRGLVLPDAVVTTNRLAPAR
jgi:hypothetical protein